ncbi:MAG: hypothetical protein F2754_10510 [Actinobacteria bacterium]|uniref:Unannotated protein n=1 Tax=freshwater metagenome TaxID=449393 RepID=A0A6J7JN78_9ZZZZ|nr:hypothetical protein [Actinomycetota bacterium]MSX87808.1 hypothetical protein [Actinomycetota bacterium]MSY72069.1 hypothetical protein [Actinomycetota bacterium]
MRARDDVAVATPDIAAPPTGTHPGERLLRAALIGTALFTLTSFAAVLARSLRGVAAVVAGALFVLGILAFFGAYFRAVLRSREELLGIGGIYFLAGSAPRRVRTILLGSFSAQLIVAVVTASLRPFTSLAFGMLVPMYGIGVSGLWGAFHGKYPERREQSASLTADE